MTPVTVKRRCLFSIAVSFALGLMCCATVANALELKDFFKRSDQRAAELLENGQTEAAANEFKDPQWRGVSRYRAGLYQEAMEDFSSAEDAQGLYNHGTAAARAGDYSQSVASLTQALKLAPQDTNIAHNLAVVKKLKELADAQQDQQQNQEGENQQGDQEQQEGEQGQNGEQNSDDESESEQQGEQEGQQPEGESDSSQTEADSRSEESQQTDEQQEQDAEALREMMQQEQIEQQNETEEAQQQLAAPAADPVSEDDQATEQWLRRIPDDPSLLLRNKIRLNHLIEHPDVDDMQEPW